MLNSIGGFLGLEIGLGAEFHKNALRLNTGRNAFEYILRAKRFQKIYIPYYTCDVMLEPILKLKLKYEFYAIDNNFRPLFDFKNLNEEDVFVYTNYYGLCDIIVKEVSSKCKNLIIDNAQAFYSLPLSGVDTFYSPRKFFGIPDGAYLYTNSLLSEPITTDISYNRFKHLLGRIDVGAEEFYNVFRKNDDELSGQPIKTMSNLTKKLLESINYRDIAEKRKQNFNYLNKKFKSINQLQFELENNSIPLVYPLLIEDGLRLKKELINNKIYVATYWPNVTDRLNYYTEVNLTNNTLNLPIDQRYDSTSLDLIIETVLKNV